MFNRCRVAETSRTMLRGDDESDISAHLYPAVHYLFCVLFYLLDHSKALWPFLYLIFKYFISRSLPSPSPSHSAVLAHSSVQLISNSASLPLCFARCLPLLHLNHFLSSPTFPPFGRYVITLPHLSAFIMLLTK